MQQYLKKLTRIEGGNLLRMLTRERLNAIQDAIRALANGDNLTVSGGLRKAPGDGRVKLRGAAPVAGRGGEAVAARPLTIVDARPSYIPPDETPVAEGYKRYYITWGMVNGMVPDNWDNCVDIPVTAPTRRYFFIKAYLDPVTEDPMPPEVIVSSCEWVVFTQAEFDAGDHRTPAYSAGGDRPLHMFIMIGEVNVQNYPDPETPTAYVFNSTSGSINIIEYIQSINFTISGGGTSYLKALNPLRLPPP